MGFKKRYIVLGLLALELASLPLGAHLIHKQVISFDTSALTNPQRAINIKLNSGPGVTRFMVSANAPFTVTSEGAIGTMDVSIYKRGRVNGQAYGSNTQSPGAASACAVINTPAKKTIYTSERGTITQDQDALKDILTKTILVDIRYNPSMTPDIKILTQKKAANLLAAPVCGNPTVSET